MSSAPVTRRLSDEPAYFADCCVGISHRLIATLANRLPKSPSLVLSIGSGSGLLEAILLQTTQGGVNLHGVEVPTCENKYLPSDRMLRVPSTTALHPDAILAEVLLFVYPRGSALMTSYLDRFVGGALEKIVWIGQRSEWPEAERVLLASEAQTAARAAVWLTTVRKHVGLIVRREYSNIRSYLALFPATAMATLAIIPDLPDRHPGRFYRVETTDLPPPTLSEELIDQWEHATLLFYGYEWQASAENFLYLSSIIDLQFESAQCLVNAAIIFARLGDYNVASEALEGAVKADEFRALALYLWGHVEFELGDLQEAERCFKAALVELGDNKQYFARLGLDFVLDAPKIRHNLSAFDIQNISLDTIPDLGSAALPSDSVFESPQRPPDSGYASPQSPQSPTKPEDTTRHEEHEDRSSKRTPKALLAQSRQDTTSATLTHTLRSLEYSHGQVQWHEPVGSAPAGQGAQPATALAPKRSVRSIGGIVRQLSTRRKSSEDEKAKSPRSPKSPKSPIFPKLHGSSPKTGLLSRLVPREAKVKDDSTRELAGFIRDLPPQRSSAGEARDGRADDASTRELASFLRASGPSGEDSRMQVDSDSGLGGTGLRDHDDHDTHSVVSDDFGREGAAPEHDVTMRDPAPHGMNQTTGGAFAPSVHSVLTEATSAMADDEASDSGNDTDHDRSRDPTPTPPRSRPVMG